MSDITLKVLALEGVCNTIANAYNSVGLIKLTNVDTAAHLITLSFANGTAYGSTTILANCELYIQKGYTDTLASNATTAVVLATPIRRGTV